MEEPLLEPGLHDFRLSDIGNHFLQDFSESNTRKRLIAELEQYTKLISNFLESVELWLDGSFTTTKLNPNDIDLVVFISAEEANALPTEKKEQLRGLLDNPTIKSRFGLDVYVSIMGDEPQRSYWRGWFGFDRDEQPKGIARVMVKA